MTLKSIFKDLNVCSVILLYRIVLDYIYVKIISIFYSSLGFNNNSTKYSYIISWLFLFSLIPFVIKLSKKNTFTNSVLILLSGVSLIPTTTLIGFLDCDFKFVLLTYVYWFCLFCYNIYFPNVKLKSKNNILIFVAICFILCATVLYVSGKFTGFRFHLGLTDVYDLRFEAREYDINMVLNYIMGAANTLLPIILVYFMLKRKKVISIVLIMVILLNFGIGGHKSVLFSLILAIFGFYLYTYKRTIYAFPILLIVNLFGLVEYIVTKSYLLSSIFTNRLLMIPSLLNYQYYDYFKNNELDYFRQGFLRWFGIESPYSENIAFMIGGIYAGNYESRANNGLFTDAYYNAGVVGVLAFPLILVFICRIIEAASKGMDERLMFVSVYTVSLNFLSTTFTTALLTGGILLMIILFLFIPRPINSLE